MRTPIYDPNDLVNLFKKQKIADMSQLKQALGTSVDVTVFRKLRELSYQTSYSHRGRFYTLAELTHFNDQGLWSFQSVEFSKYGTLLATVEAFVAHSDAGYYASELSHVLAVEVKEALLKLVRGNRIVREKFADLYLYCSAEAGQRKAQLSSRKTREAEPSLRRSVATEESMDHELKAAVLLFFSLLDEKQRRLYSGLESLKIGHGGDRQVAEFIGTDVHTVARGRKELLRKDFEIEGVRRSGGGRPLIEKKHLK